MMKRRKKKRKTRRKNQRMKKRNQRLKMLAKMRMLIKKMAKRKRRKLLKKSILKMKSLIKLNPYGLEIPMIFLRKNMENSTSLLPMIGKIILLLNISASRVSLSSVHFYLFQDVHHLTYSRIRNKRIKLNCMSDVCSSWKTVKN